MPAFSRVTTVSKVTGLELSGRSLIPGKDRNFLMTSFRWDLEPTQPVSISRDAKRPKHDIDHVNVKNPKILTSTPLHIFVV